MTRMTCDLSVRRSLGGPRTQPEYHRFHGVGSPWDRAIEGTRALAEPTCGSVCHQKLPLAEPPSAPAQSLLTVAVPHLTSQRQWLLCIHEGLVGDQDHFPEGRCLSSQHAPFCEGRVGLDPKRHLRFV